MGKFFHKARIIKNKKLLFRITLFLALIVFSTVFAYAMNNNNPNNKKQSATNADLVNDEIHKIRIETGSLNLKAELTRIKYSPEENRIVIGKDNQVNIAGKIENIGNYNMLFDTKFESDNNEILPEISEIDYEFRLCEELGCENVIYDKKGRLADVFNKKLGEGNEIKINEVQFFQLDMRINKDLVFKGPKEMPVTLIFEGKPKR